MSDSATSYDSVGDVERIMLDFRRRYRRAPAERLLRELVEKAQLAKDSQTVADARLAQAALARDRQSLPLARQLARGALQYYERQGDRAGQARAHLELAKIDLDWPADPEPELQAAQASVFDTQEIGARCDYVRARTALRQGRLALARILLRRALRLLEDRDCPYYRARYLAQLGFIERLRGARSAQEHLREACRLARRGGFRRIEAYCLLDLGQIALRRKNLLDAKRQLTQAVTLFEAINDELGQAHALSALGSVWRQTPHYTRAIQILERALGIYARHKNLPGAALAHRRLAQAFIDLLASDSARDQPLFQAHYDRAEFEVNRAYELFAQQDSLDGKAAVLATKAKLLYVTEGHEAALDCAMLAVELLGEARGQFRQGLERLEFGRLHSWIFGFAMLCATQNNDAAKALRVAAIVRAETLGGVARYTLRDLPGELGARLREMFEHEQGLRPSASDAVRLAISMEELRERREYLYGALDRDLAEALTPPLDRPPLTDGHYRLVVAVFDDDLYVLCEGPSAGDADVKPVEASERDRVRVEALAAGDKDAVEDARGWDRLGDLFVRRDLGALRSHLLNGDVEILEIEPARDLVTFPFGSLLVEGRPLDELTCVLLSPSHLPSWLWHGREDRPGATTAAPPQPGPDDAPSALGAPVLAASFQDIVDAMLTEVATGTAGGVDRSFSTIELMDIATGEETLKRLFASDAAVARHFLMTCEQLQQEGLGLREAVRAAKMSHRRGCRRACPPAHVGAFVVAGRLPQAESAERHISMPVEGRSEARSPHAPGDPT